jgi:toxin ParE1/3/4
VNFKTTVRTIAPHHHAIADVHEIICYYREQAGTAVAENFAIEINEAYARLRQHPNIGPPRPAFDLDIEGVKSWTLKRFPHQIFYEIQNNHVELWRILHPRRDITQATLTPQRF